jgi:hypothetical protein
MKLAAIDAFRVEGKRCDVAGSGQIRRKARALRWVLTVSNPVEDAYTSTSMLKLAC